LEIWNHNYRSFSSLTRARIDEKTKKNFIDLVAGISEDPYQHYLEASVKSEAILKEVLPETTQGILHDFGKKGRSVVLLQDCPVVATGIIPPTPTKSSKPTNKDWVSEYLMLGLSRFIGAKPYVIEEVRDGSVINQLIPLDPSSNSGSGSKIPFNLHNEVVHEAKVPDFFILLCLRGNPMAKTTYCFLEDIIKLLPPEIIAELEKPNFLMKSGDPSVFKDAKTHRCPILTKDEFGNYQIRLNTAAGRCEGLTDGAKIALEYVKHCLNTNINIHGVSLAEGDVLLVNNKQTLHGRTSFDVSQEDISSGQNRWVQRVNLIQDSEHSRT
jgi:hypothetical protein